MALSGLARARALEQYVDAHPGHARACDSLVEAARVRDAAGDPDGSCEDLVRAVEAYPSARSAPDAIEGLAACEQRRGRAAEARRLQARLARDYPDSPAGKRAREHAPAAQGAAP
jgi:TolA-binding protein